MDLASGVIMFHTTSGRNRASLETTEGNVIHYGYIEKFIEGLGERFNIREIAFDRWGRADGSVNLEGMGFTITCPFGQGFKDMVATYQRA